MKYISPRLCGVREHIGRANFFFSHSKRDKDIVASHRLMMAAIYSCRAIVEIMLEAAEKQEIKNLKDNDPKANRKNLESKLSTDLPYYFLVEKIRIHDFQRFGLLPPDSRLVQMQIGGPIKMRVQKGSASVFVTQAGMQEHTSGESKVEFQRPLLIKDDLFFDEASSKYVKLEDVLSSFLAKVEAVVSDIEKSMA